MLLTGHHATPVVILVFSLINVTCIALHHTTPMLLVLVIRHSTSVTYGKHATSAMSMVTLSSTASAKNLRQRLLLSDAFYLALLPAFSRLPCGQQFNLNVSRASCWSLKHIPELTICFNHSNTQTIYMR